eukprot:1600753-Rhodomonas_salina.1
METARSEFLARPTRSSIATPPPGSSISQISTAIRSEGGVKPKASERPTALTGSLPKMPRPLFAAPPSSLSSTYMMPERLRHSSTTTLSGCTASICEEGGGTTRRDRQENRSGEKEVVRR